MLRPVLFPLYHSFPRLGEAMSAQDIHNISFLGYYDTEKITLLESVAHHFGAILRQGVVTDGLNNRRGQILRMDTEGEF